MAAFGKHMQNWLRFINKTPVIKRPTPVSYQAIAATNSSVLCIHPIIEQVGRCCFIYNTTRRGSDLDERQSNSDDAEPESDGKIEKSTSNIDVHTSIRYLKSKAYKTTYGNDPVWKHYRRNFKGSIPPATRRTCIRNNVISTGNPCPICRDEYLVLDHLNVSLLEQFISEHSNEVLPSMRTGICQEQHKRLVLAVEKAHHVGLLEATVPFREYDYSEYLEELKNNPSAKSNSYIF